MRAEKFGDLWFIDHVDITIQDYLENGNKETRIYVVLIVLDASTNLVHGQIQKSKLHDDTISALMVTCDRWQVFPKAIVADSYFLEPKFLQWFGYHNIKPIGLGPNTPWPNRAEAAVKTFKLQTNILCEAFMSKLNTEPGLENITMQQVVNKSSWARNTTITYGGVTPLEAAFGRRPPDIISIETMTPNQLCSELPPLEKTNNFLRDLAITAHLQARQRIDLQRDLAARLRPSCGPWEPGLSIWFWERDESKIRSGEWVASKILSLDKLPMLNILWRNTSIRVNSSKVRLNPDPWHDVVVPGLQGRDAVPTVPTRQNNVGEVSPKTPPAPIVLGDRELQEDGLPSSIQLGLVEPEHLWSPSEPEDDIFWLVDDKDFLFQQLYTMNDKLSSVVSGLGYSVGLPVDISKGYGKVCNDKTQKLVA